MAKLGSTPSTQEIYMQVSKAEAGDPEAINWILEQNNLLSKRANERMRYMENTGYVDAEGKGTAAYERAQYYLGEEGRDRFYTGTKKDLEDITDNLIQAGNFLRSQTSTVRGELARREKIFGSLEEGGWIDVPDDPKMQSRFKRNFNRFLESDAWKDVKKTLGSGVISAASEAIQNGARVGDLLNMFKEYQQREEVDIFDVWDSWSMGKRKINV